MLIDPARQRAAQVVGQDLHVAREHDELDVQLLDQLEQPRLGLRPWSPASPARGGTGCRRTRRAARRARVVATPRRRARSAACSDRWRNSRSFRQCAAVEHHDERAHRPADDVERPVHLERRGDRGERRLAARRATLAPSTCTRMKNRPGQRVPELLRLGDVPPVLGEQPGDRVHDPGAVGAGEGQDPVGGGRDESEDTRSESSGRADRLTRWARMTQPDLDIRSVTLDDAGELLTLRRAAFVTEAQQYGDPHIPPLTQTLEELQEDLQRDGVITLGGWYGHRLVGSIRMLIEGPKATLGRFAVAPDLQGQGFGTQLLMAILPHLPEGIEEVWVFTGRDSVHNLALYAKHGLRAPARPDRRRPHLRVPAQDPGRRRRRLGSRETGRRGPDPRLASLCASRLAKRVGHHRGAAQQQTTGRTPGPPVTTHECLPAPDARATLTAEGVP